MNGLATVLLVLGVLAIKAGQEQRHKRFMLGAFGVSVLFLISYVLHHAQHGSTPYRGEGSLRVVYLSILATHVVLAALVPFLALRTIWLGLKDDRVRHRFWARITVPIWLYVSITGVVIYVMLYRLDGA